MAADCRGQDDGAVGWRTQDEALGETVIIYVGAGDGFATARVPDGHLRLGLLDAGTHHGGVGGQSDRRHPELRAAAEAKPERLDGPGAPA